ncbi:mesoderm posterior protein 1-like [Hyperolius riggenbachi]|uniref:mesoderm posterior protein 1-like n=1 Tax=Hyperolius riggenbachi TaxID=752182 RepID=UPI0035A3D59B
MAFCPAQQEFQEKMLSSEYTKLQQWGYPDSEGYGTLSPTSSVDSFSFSPSYQSCAFSEDPYSNFQTSLSQSENLQNRQKQLPAKKRSRIVTSHRQSASEREKMRMRNLSTALQSLRKYLPPAVAPAGKSLTKIETLRLTIRYISHLSDVLGLDDETLEKRREERLRRSRCPIGLNCCQEEMHEMCSMTSTHQTQTFPHCTGSPSACPEPTRHNTECLLPALPSPQFSDHGLSEEVDALSPCAQSSTPAYTTTLPNMKENFSDNPPISPDLGFCQDMIDDMWDEFENKDQWSTIHNKHHPVLIQNFC